MNAARLFLVGDIIDGWQLKRRWYWNEAQSRVVAEILAKVDAGTRVIFVPGNHDEFARDYAGRLFAGIEVAGETIHETADGKRLLVLHGDRFDGVIACAKWLAHVGDWAYGVALALERSSVRRAQAARPALLVALGLAEAQGQERGRIYLAHSRKRSRRKLKNGAWTAWSAATSTMLKSASIGGVLYLNDGDWVESCSALVEDARGNLEILRWATPTQRTSPEAPAEAAVPALIPA